MKVFIFLADGFEVLETFSPVDVLKRCGAEVITVSIKKDLVVESSQKNKFIADTTIDKIDYQTADLIIIPGGYPGYINLRENQKVVEIVKVFIEKNKYVASICGGPTIFSKNNLAYGTKLTGHSSVRKELEENHIYIEKTFTIDKNIITAVGAGYALDFSFFIADQFFSKEVIEKVKKGMELI